MALYIPAGRRRRRVILAAVVGVVVGLLIGVLAGRASAPTVADKVATVRSHARETAAGLRVVVLHDQSGITSAGDGTDLVLQRTRTELDGEIHDAVWLPAAQASALRDQLAALTARTDKDGPAFAADAESMAKAIEAAFGA